MRRIVILTVLSVAGCELPKKEEAGQASVQEKSETGEVIPADDPLSTFKLSEALTLKIPPSVLGNGAGVSSGATDVERKKSLKACKVRSIVSEAKMHHEQIVMQLCALEAQKGLLSGGRFKMKIPGNSALLLQDNPSVFPEDFGPGGPLDPGAPGPGEPSPPDDYFPKNDPPQEYPVEEMVMSVFVDRSIADKFTVFVCQNEKLSQKIVIEKVGNFASKSSYKTLMDIGPSTYEQQGTFDNGVESAGHQRLTSRAKFRWNINEKPNSSSSDIELDLVENGVSLVRSASEWTSSLSAGAPDREISAALIDPNLGSVLFQATPFKTSSTVTDSTTTATELETTRSFFDSAGKVVAKESSPSFADGGILHVTESQLPKLVADDFKVESEPSDWNCSGTTDFTYEPGSDVEACYESTLAPSSESCYGDDFEPSPN
jgi:hypothetical protein